MRLAFLREHLFPSKAEQDEGLRQEIYRVSDAGLKLLAGAQFALAALLVLARIALPGDSAMHKLLMFEAGALTAVGALTLAVTRIENAYPWSRLAGVASQFATGFILIAFSLLLRHRYDAEDLIPGQTTLIMLVTAAALPLLPMQTLGMGMSLGACYCLLAGPLSPDAGVQPPYVLYIVTITLITTGLSAVMYSQRAAGYRAYMQTVHALEGLRQAQSRMLLAENAASLGRLAAALSHELNSPIGALMSSVDTLLLLAARQATSPPSQQERLVKLQAELRASVHESAKRLEQIVRRMQRFTNLDRAEIQEANVNDILTDVCALLEPQIKGKASVDLDLHPLPLTLCRPQQISAVFSNLLTNALGAVNDQGHIVVSTCRRDVAIEIRIADDGKGIPPEQISNAFDPSFRVNEGRVSAGNWSLFNARQIIREHGGDIRIAGNQGRGTTVTITLPVDANPLAAKA